jgi:hypothetical protein
MVIRQIAMKHERVSLGIVVYGMKMKPFGNLSVVRKIRKTPMESPNPHQTVHVSTNANASIIG